MTEFDVLVVGGSLNGLSIACFLAKLGVQVAVFERHADVPVQYKFRGISPRSMEIYRSFGLEPDIRSHSATVGTEAIARVRNLADPNPHWTDSGWFDATGISATQFATRDQDELEPILRRHAEAAGARINFKHDVLKIEIANNQVALTVKDLGAGSTQRFTGRYLIGADGIAGQTRTAAGIGRSGPGLLQHWANIIFESDLQPVIEGRAFTSAFVTDVNGTLVQRKAGGHWLLALQYAPEQGQSLEEFDEAHCQALLERAAGHGDFSFKLVDVRSWSASGFLADAYRRGPIFLIGDAAHSMPPTGGFGGNTGIHDAHNLAWKLAAVVHGEVAPSFLDTYEKERLPVARATLAQALARLSAWFKNLGDRLPPPVAIVPDDWVVFGQAYRTGGFVGDGPEQAFEDPRSPSSREGTRAPHFRLKRAGHEVNVHDLFGHSFVLLTDRPDDWRQFAEAFVAEIAIVDVAEGPATGFAELYGINRGGAVLVRPDGIIAWRTRTPMAEEFAVAAINCSLGLVEKKECRERVTVA